MAQLSGHVRAVSGVRLEVRARAGLLPGRDVFQLPAFDSAGARAGAAGVAADAVAVRRGAGGGVRGVPSVRAGCDTIGARAVYAHGPAFRPGLKARRAVRNAPLLRHTWFFAKSTRRKERSPARPRRRRSLD